MDSRDAPQGWRCIVQFGLIFFLAQWPAFEALKTAAERARAMRVLSDGAVPLNLYPWSWDDGSGDADGAGALTAERQVAREQESGGQWRRSCRRCSGGGEGVIGGGGGGGADADVESFEALQRSVERGGHLRGAHPAGNHLNREPEAVLEWVDCVATNYDFKRIIPRHMQNDVKATPADS